VAAATAASAQATTRKRVFAGSWRRFGACTGRGRAVVFAAFTLAGADAVAARRALAVLPLNGGPPRSQWGCGIGVARLLGCDGADRTVVSRAQRYLQLVSRRAKLAGAVVAVVALTVTAITVAVAVARPGDEKQRSEANATPSVEQRFAVLSRARSNQCGLQAEGLETMARNGRLQGSCYSPIDLHRYREQLEGLRRYRDVPQVPGDPYDIPVSLAKRLFAYQQTIKLTPGQQAVYDRAFKLSGDHGPCCCRCWRWTAFEGQAKFLITRRDFSAKQIADIWLLEGGCGGAGHEGEHRS
jgi:hypothetical protein